MLIFDRKKNPGFERRRTDTHPIAVGTASCTIIVRI